MILRILLTKAVLPNLKVENEHVKGVLVPNHVFVGIERDKLRDKVTLKNWNFGLQN